MAPQKTEIKVTINCQKCRTKVLKTVAKLQGVDHLSLDSDKGMLTVIGEVDPVCVTTQIRKTGKVAKIITVGPPKAPDSQKPKPKPEPPKPEPNPNPLPTCCAQCRVIAITYEPYEVCSIL